MQNPNAGLSPEEELISASRVDNPASVRLHLRLAYDGTLFHGWARQPQVRTVQAEVEDALALVLRSPHRLPVVCAGRTDAGVHARDQHVHVDVPSGLLVPFVASPTATDPTAASLGDLPVDVAASIELSGLARRLNGVLGDDVRVGQVEIAPPGFDARFSVKWRQYEYRIADGAPLDPLRRHFVWHRPGELDLAAMDALAGSLLGEHDFAALCRHRPDASTVRTILALGWARDVATGEAVMTVRADAFCHSMVRSLVGLMVAVGDGTRTEQWARDIVAAGRRRPEVVAVPPHGLVLAEVAYAEDAAAQATRARRFRG